MGERVLDDLVAAGYPVTAHVHSDSSRRLVESKYPALRIVQADLSEPEQVRGIIPDGTEVVIWLPGILREWPKRGETFQRVHVDGVRNLLADAKRVGVSRWIECSALGAAPGTGRGYYDSKWQAEELVRASGIAHTVVRPSLIFDDRPRRQHNFVDEIVAAIRMSPFVPVLGSGKYLLQPVSVADVARTIVQSLGKPETIGKTYDLGGPAKMTYRELIVTIARAMHTRKPALRVPIWLALSAAWLFQGMRSFPITVDEIRMLTGGNFVRDPEREREWRATFELEATPFNEEAVMRGLGS